MENWLIPHAAAQLPVAQRVLVLAPHPDDEVFGCAGALHTYAQRGTSVQVHVLTDGAGYAPAGQRVQIAAVRMAETQAALAILGVGEASSAGFPDRGLSGLRQQLGTHLADLLVQHQPDLVLAPAPSEVHPDHRALAWALQDLLQPPAAQASGRSAYPLTTLMFYEVGALQHPSLLLDITPLWPLKWAAMQCFKSQLDQQDYAGHIEGLNRYRSYTLGGAVRYAEAYRVHSVADAYGLSHILSPQPADSALKNALSVATALSEDQQLQILAIHSQLAELGLQLSSTQQQLSSTQQQLNRAERELSSTQQQLQAQMLQIQALLQSHSWRITRPLRWLSQQARRFKGPV